MTPGMRYNAAEPSGCKLCVNNAEASVEWCNRAGKCMFDVLTAREGKRRAWCVLAAGPCSRLCVLCGEQLRATCVCLAGRLPHGVLRARSTRHSRPPCAPSCRSLCPHLGVPGAIPRAAQSELQRVIREREGPIVKLRASRPVLLTDGFESSLVTHATWCGHVQN